MLRKLFFGACLVFAGWVASAPAQDSLLLELYGQGVHAYFAGDYSEAFEILTQAIDQGTQDPRCYYYRGLAYTRLGRPDEAEADFKRGAELEASGVAVQIDIGPSLQRIQGRVRMQLEKERYAAKLAVHSQSAAQRRERYESIQRNEPRVVRDTDTVRPDAPVQPPASTDPTDPFGGLNPPGTAPPVVVPSDEPTPTPPPANDPFGQPSPKPVDPFAEPGKPADPFGAPVPPTADDPFADPVVPVVVPPDEPGAAPPAQPAPQPNDPFGDPAAPATDPADPFGAPAKPAPQPADPFGAPADPADPFGAPAKPAAPPAKPAGNDDDVDPFADDPAPPAKPAANGQSKPKENNDDPFGADPFGN